MPMPRNNPGDIIRSAEWNELADQIDANTDDIVDINGIFATGTVGQVLEKTSVGAGANTVGWRAPGELDHGGNAAHVSDFGAVGDGIADDTAAIQDALDSDAAVVILDGIGAVYLADGLDIPSNTTLDLNGNTLRSFDGVDTGVIRVKKYSASAASVDTEGNITLTSGHSIPDEAYIGIREAFRSPNMADTAVGSGTSSSTSLTITNSYDRAFAGGDRLAGWPTGSGNYIWVNDELVGYTSFNPATGVFSGLTRGVQGTTAAAWTTGATVHMAMDLMGYYQAAGSTIRPVPQNPEIPPTAQYPLVTKTGGFITWGAINAAVINGTIDSNQATFGAVNNPYAAYVFGARFFRCENVTFMGGHGSGLFLQQSSDCYVVGNRFTANGNSAAQLGSQVWVIGNCFSNHVKNNTFYGDAYNAIGLDDRTVTAADHGDGVVAFNEVTGNIIHMAGATAGSGGISTTGCFNTISGNTIVGAFQGIRVLTGNQGTDPAIPHSNVIVGNVITHCSEGINLDDSPLDVDGDTTPLDGATVMAGNVFHDCSADVLYPVYELVLSATAATTLSISAQWTGEVGDVVVDWGDASTSTLVDNTVASHTYGSPYTGTVTISFLHGVSQLTNLNLQDAAAWSWSVTAKDLPRSLQVLRVSGTGTVITGDVKHLPRRIYYLDVSGTSSVLTGDVAGLPRALALFVANTTTVSLTGKVSGLPPAMTYMVTSGTAWKLSAPSPSWNPTLLRRVFNISNASPGTALTAAQVNAILVRIVAANATPTDEKLISIAGLHAAPDSSSGGFDGTAAKTTLQGRGWTVTTN